MTTPTPKWHQFRDTADGDDQCTKCGAVVTIDAYTTFTAPCPVPACPSPKNPDPGCVFAPHKDGPCRCIFCGRPGGRVEEIDDDFDPGVGEAEPGDLG